MSLASTMKVPPQTQSSGHGRRLQVDAKPPIANAGWGEYTRWLSTLSFCMGICCSDLGVFAIIVISIYKQERGERKSRRGSRLGDCEPGGMLDVGGGCEFVSGLVLFQ